IERCRAADVEPVPEHAAEAQIGDSLRNVDLAEQLAGWVVAADAVLVRIAPAHRAPVLPSVSARMPSVMLGLGISANTLLFETFPAPTSTSKTRMCDGLSGPSVKPVSIT